MITTGEKLHLARVDENDKLLKLLEFKWFEIKNLLRFTCSPRVTKNVIEEMDKLSGWVSDEMRRGADEV